MTEIIDLKAKRDERRLIWACACGCTVHYHHADGGVECGSCGNYASGATPGWREQLAATPVEPKPLDADNFKVVQMQSAEMWLRRQLKDEPEQLIALIALRRDGGLSTFSDGVETDEQRAWLERKFAQALALITTPDQP